jgi:hypothetical protein
VNASIAAVLAQPHAINAHKSAHEASVYVACGNIAAQTPTSVPRTGGGGMSQGRGNPLTLIGTATMLALALAGSLYTMRRRAA